MKKFHALLLFILAVALFPACQKSSVPYSEYSAHLSKAGPDSDGPPVDELILDSTGEVVVPINKTANWPQTNRVAVSVRFADTGKEIPLIVNGKTVYLREVFLVSLRGL